MEYEASQNYRERNARASALLVKTMQEVNRMEVNPGIKGKMQEMLDRNYDERAIDISVDKLLEANLG